MKRIFTLVGIGLAVVASVACTSPTPTSEPSPLPTPTIVLIIPPMVDPTVIVPTNTPTEVDLLPETYALKDVSMTLERTACFGTCPIYTVTIQGDGTVNYAGIDFVKLKGTQTRQISRDAVVELLRQFYQNDFFGFRPEYVEGRDISVDANGIVTESNVMVTDLPTTIVTLRIGTFIKSVRAYYGAPEAVYTLATHIDETAGTAEWVRP